MKPRSQNNGKITLALIGQKLDTLSDTVTRIDYTINGKEDEPGLKGRLQRLEDYYKSVRWYIRSVWAAIAASGIGIYFKG